MPQVILTPEQRRVQLVSREPAPPSTPGTAAVLFSFPNLRKGGEHRVRMSWLFDRYAVETQVTPAKVPPYVTGSNLYRTFTAPDLLVPSTNPEIVKAAAAAVGGEKNPYLRARRLYDWQLAQLSWSSTVRDGDALLALRMKRADGVRLRVAVLRAAARRGHPGPHGVRGPRRRDSGSPACAISGTSFTSRASAGFPWTRCWATSAPSCPPTRQGPLTRRQMPGRTTSATWTTGTSPSPRGWRR